MRKGKVIGVGKNEAAQYILLICLERKRFHELKIKKKKISTHHNVVTLHLSLLLGEFL